jgi:hypothetical protein
LLLLLLLLLLLRPPPPLDIYFAYLISTTLVAQVNIIIAGRRGRSSSRG